VNEWRDAERTDAIFSLAVKRGPGTTRDKQRAEKGKSLVRGGSKDPKEARESERGGKSGDWPSWPYCKTEIREAPKSHDRKKRDRLIEKETSSATIPRGQYSRFENSVSTMISRSEKSHLKQTRKDTYLEGSTLWRPGCRSL